MDIDLTDHVIVVTGAAGGLGRALCHGLADRGARVAAWARTEERAQQVVDEVAAAHPGAPPALAVGADLTDEEQVRRAAALTDERCGRVDALVNNAGLMTPHGPKRVLEMPVTTLHEVLDANLVSAFLVTQHVAPLMIRGGGGRIVFMSSMIGVQAGPGGAAYGAAKAGLNLLAHVVHRELADDGIRSVAVAPGLTDTPGARASASEEHIAAVAKTYPGGRVGQPDDIVPFVAFLCSEGAEHVSGTFLPIRPVTG